ncbi:hypothetical protein KKH05_03095 [Patescibacteria group bacterium]|nr:hypothetical protein [Patescibacteria group bacterium]
MKHERRNKGQVMILSVLLISSAVLAASSLAGSLVLFQLKRTAGAEDSARAIFAADAGMEHALYTRFVTPGACDVNPIEPGDDFFTFKNEDIPVSYIVKFDAECKSAQSLGLSNRTARAFEIGLDGLCAFGGQSSNCPVATTTPE